VLVDDSYDLLPPSDQPSSELSIRQIIPIRQFFTGGSSRFLPQVKLIRFFELIHADSDSLPKTL
jgi:hypothetical protein